MDGAASRAIRQLEERIQDTANHWHDAATTGSAGFLPALDGNTTHFLRGDGTWQEPPSSSGGVSDGDKGDITVSASGATWTIDAGVVTSAKVADDNITNAKLANMADSTIKGRAAGAGTGDPVDLTAAQVKTVLAIAAGDVSGLATVATTGSAADLGTGTLPAGRMPALTGDVTTTVGTVSATIAASAVTYAKIQNVTASRILGNNGPSPAAPEELTGAEVTAMLSAFSSGAQGVAPASGGGTTNFLRADGTWAAPGGGSDPWTYVKLGSNFVTSLATNANVTGLSFTPSANLTYVVEGFFLLRTATATVGARPGIAWPTGMSDSTAQITAPNSATASAFRNVDSTTTQNAASTGLANTTSSHPGTLWATFVTGASPSGSFQITLASETAGTSVTMRAGSWIRYRTI
jgi:hypothetical protein